jgi:meso-butanediol dehydrogenase/(S,S)-butanediol dehydrogenase/diacetyl reductase
MDSGTIETPMVKAAVAAREAQGANKEDDKYSQSLNALGRNGQPEEVAKLVAFLLSDESSYITGECISIDGGWHC